MRLFFLATLIGCPPTTTEKWPSTADADGDGWSVGKGDCDDNDPARHPDVTEVCDGIDANCDEMEDDELWVTAYADSDGDGYGSEREDVCPGTPGYADKSGDCDEEDPEIHPGVPEVCDGVDQDCNGEADDGVTLSWYTDHDQDGYGTAAASGCAVPATGAPVTGDCDDTDATVHPDAEEIWCDDIDNDCSEATRDGEACPGDTAIVRAVRTAHVQLADGALVSGETTVQWRNLNLDKTVCAMGRSIEQTGPMGTCHGCKWAFEYTLGPITTEGDGCDLLPGVTWWGIADSSELAFTYDFPVRFSRGTAEITYYYTALTAGDLPIIEDWGSANGIGLVPRGLYVYSTPYDVYTSGIPYGYWYHMYTITY